MQNSPQEHSEGADERAEVEAMIRRHAETTKSERAWKILASWEGCVPKFVKVVPKDYQRILDAFVMPSRRDSAAKRPSWKRLKQIKTTWRASAEIENQRLVDSWPVVGKGKSQPRITHPWPLP